MFPSSIQKLIDDATPKINRALGDGLAIKHMQVSEENKGVEGYVDSIFQSAAKSFPPGLVYLGGRRCTPIEEFNETTKKKGNRYVFDVARSDVYLMEYKFRYNDEKPIVKYLSLPFVGEAGTIYISGSRFVISPILSDKVISVGLSNIFIRLSKARLTFNRLTQNYEVNGSRDAVQVAWSDIYNVKQNDNAPKKTIIGKCTLTHYLLCKYGFSDTFRLYGNCVPIIGGFEINVDTYPADEWNICSSSCYDTPNKPKGFGKSYYEPSPIRLAIRKTEFTPIVRNLVGGFFYCVDHFPSFVIPEYIDHKELWMWLLGQLIWSGNVSRGKLVNDVTDHISSLDDYVDGIVSDKLKDIGYYCDDIYQIFALIINNFDEWILASDDRINTVYDKELSILYFICYEISSAIFNLSFKLKAAQKKEINNNKIITIMNMNLKPGTIFKITREHGEVTTTSSSGDNKALKTTMLLVPQGSSSRTKSKKDRMAIDDPGIRLNASLAEVCSYNGLPKSEPSGRARLNVFVNIDSTGLVLRNPKYIPLIDNVQALIRR